MLERSPVLDRSFRRLADDFPKGTHRKACGVGKAADLISDNVSKLNNPFALLHLRKPDDVNVLRTIRLVSFEWLIRV